MANESETKLIIPALGGLYGILSDHAYTIVRFFAGLFLVPHGAQKLFGIWGGSIEGTAGFIEKVGLGPGVPLAYLVGCTEFFGGILIAIGLWTRLAALAVAIQMFVIVFAIKMSKGFFGYLGGYEYEMLWAILMIAIFFRGGGATSVDAKLGKEF